MKISKYLKTQDEGAKYIGDRPKDWKTDHSPEYATDQQTRTREYG